MALFGVGGLEAGLVGGRDLIFLELLDAEVEEAVGGHVEGEVLCLLLVGGHFQDVVAGVVVPRPLGGDVGRGEVVEQFLAGDHEAALEGDAGIDLVEVLHRPLVQEAQLSGPVALGRSLHRQRVGVLILLLLDDSAHQLVPRRVGHEAVLGNRLLVLALEDYPAVLDAAEVGVLLEEGLIGLAEVVVLPGGVGEGLDELKGKRSRHFVVSL